MKIDIRTGLCLAAVMTLWSGVAFAMSGAADAARADRSYCPCMGKAWRILLWRYADALSIFLRPRMFRPNKPSCRPTRAYA